MTFGFVGLCGQGGQDKQGGLLRAKKEGHLCGSRETLTWTLVGAVRLPLVMMKRLAAGKLPSNEWIWIPVVGC